MVWHNGNKHDYNRTVHNYNPNDKSKPPAIRTGVAGRLLLSRLAFETGESISLDKLKKMLEPGTDMDTDLHFRNIKTLFTGNATGLSEIFSEVSDALSLRSELVTTDVVEFRRAIQSEKVMVLKSALEISPPKMMLSRFNDLDKRQIQWLIKGREKLQKSYQDALERLTRMLAQGGQVQDALEYRQRIVREGFADKCKDLPSEEDIKNNSCKGSFTFRRAMHQSWNVALDEFKSSRNDYLVYADMVETNLPLDSATKATDERNESAYQICAALVSLSMADDYVTEARILLPADPYVAFQQKDRSVKDKYRRVLEYGKTSGWPCWGDLEKYRLGEVPSVSNLLMRFAAGGAITILNVPSDDGGREDFVVIGQKDNGPVIHAGHLIPCSGIAESSEDWLNPLRIVVGECAEEIRLRHRKNNDWYFPVFSPQENVAGLTTQSQCDVLNEFVEVQRGKRQELLTGVTANNKKPSFSREQQFLRANFPSKNNEGKELLHPLDSDFYPPEETEHTVKGCRAEIISLGDDRITIVQEKKHGGHNKFELNGLLVPDPEFGALDMMYAMRIYLDTPLSDLRVLDSEGDDFLYWRNVSVFRPKELARLCRGDSAHVERFFGRLSPSERWIDGEPVTISEKPFINPPLRNTLGPLFGKVFPDEGGVLPFAYNQSRAITYRLEE